MSDIYEIPCCTCGDSLPVSEVVRLGENPRPYCLDCLESTIAELRRRRLERRAESKNAGSIAS